MTTAAASSLTWRSCRFDALTLRELQHIYIEDGIPHTEMVLPPRTPAA